MARIGGLPTFRSYGNYSSSNYGAHSLEFTDPRGNSFYFSYNTLVAFMGKEGIVCIKHYWSSTTGRHLNWIQPDKKRRVDKETFDRLYDEAF